MSNIELPHDFTPRPYQERIMKYFDNGGKRAVWIVHRRGGKDLTMLHQVCKMAHMRHGVYWTIFPSFAQGRKAIWEGFTKDGKRIMENVFPGFLEPKRKGSIVKRKDENQMMVELKCGSVWRLIGSDRIELVGAGPVGLVFSEYAMANPKAWNMIRPMLRENDGWAAFITTPRGRNHAKDLFDVATKDPAWFCELQTLYDTKAYDPESTMDEERRAGMPEALIKQEFLCDWSAALVGSVWGEQIDAIIKAGGMKPYNHSNGDVFTSWDLGFTDATAIWFWQVEDGGINVIDYYQENGKPLSHYFDVIEAKPYSYVKHWLPHDARQTTLSSGVSILNQFMKRFPGQVGCTPDLPILDGIQAGRWLLQQGVLFHPCTEDAVEALRQYHYEYDEEKKIFSTKPSHDWTSHIADAFRYLAAVVKHSQLLTKGKWGANGPTEVKKDDLTKQTISYRTTLSELFDEHDAQIRSRGRRIA